MTSWERLYNLVIHLLLPAVVPGHYVSFRGRDPDRHTLARFMGSNSFMKHPSPSLWIHGASVGEMNLVETLCDWAAKHGVQRDQILVTGQTYSGLNSINHDRTLLLPADYPALLEPLTTYVGSAPLIIVETEIWPNLYRMCRGKLHVFNGHLKNESFEDYCRFKGLFRSALGHCDSVLARSDNEARKFRVLANGDTSPGIDAPGDLKWTKLFGEPDEITDGPSFKDDSPVLVAGSTWPGEEERVLELVERYDVNVYLAPRHMDRLDEVKQELKGRNCSWREWTQSTGNVEAEVILVDKIGILSSLYGRGDVAFVGGSWAEDVGGHDLLEPARFGIPIWVGPHISNVRDTADHLERAGMLTELRTKSDWQNQMNRFLDGNTEHHPERGFERIKKRARDIRDGYQKQLHHILAGDDQS